jgi:hypothetical protein
MDRAEQTGLGVAVIGHAALLAALAFGLSAWEPIPLPGDPIEVSFVDDADLVSSAPQVSATPPPQGAAPLAGAPEDAPAPLPESRPAVPQPDRPAPQPAPSATQPARERLQQSRQRPNPATGERSRRTRIGEDLLEGIGRDPSPSRTQRPPATMSGAERASIRSLIARALIPCERQPFPSPEARAIRVDVRVTLNRSGGLASADVVRVINSDAALERYEQRMRDLALAVVRSCTPIRGLPEEYYDVPGGWRQFTYRFPRES